MKKIKNSKRKAFLVTLQFLSTGILLAQKLKISDGSALVDGVNKSALNGTSIAMILCGTVIAIGLVTTIYKVIHGTGSKEALIGWIAGVVLYGFALTYVLTQA